MDRDENLHGGEEDHLQDVLLGEEEEGGKKETGESTEHIRGLLNYGVDLKLIASVKNITVDDLKKLIDSGEISNKTVPQLASMMQPQTSQDHYQNSSSMLNPSNLGAPMGSMINVMGGPPIVPPNFVHMPGRKDEKGEKKPRRKSWKESEFPQEKLDNFYCLDCSKTNPVRDCECGRASWRWCNDCGKYQQPSYHFHFVQTRKKVRSRWKESDFPEYDPGAEELKEFRFYCADCKKNSTILECECGRKCWRFCDECQTFVQATNHGHFAKLRKQKRRRWKGKSFPKESDGKYYCLDCKKGNETRKCACGRDGWRWCSSCHKYLSKSHGHFRKGNRDTNRHTTRHTTRHQSALVDDGSDHMKNRVGVTVSGAPLTMSGVVHPVPVTVTVAGNNVEGNLTGNKRGRGGGEGQGVVVSSEEMKLMGGFLMGVDMNTGQQIPHQHQHGMTHQMGNLENVTPMPIQHMVESEQRNLEPPKKKRKFDD